MYLNPALDNALAKERKSGRRAVLARERRSRRHYSRGSVLPTILGLLFG
jgi:hypothetical protein